MNRDRYIRQTSLKDFGPEKQEMLLRARVLVVGAGGLGIPVLQYLKAMGVGILGLVEQDLIEMSNLQRQVIYGEGDVGKSKLNTAADKLRAMNSETVIQTHDTFLTRSNALEIIAGYDLIVDASDNFATRYLINDACVILDKPFISGAIHGFEGQVSVFNYEEGPTYRCLFPTPPQPGSVQDCNAHGVLGVIPGIIGTLQAMEVIKVITRMPGILKGKLLLYNGIDQQIRHISFPAIEANKKRKSLESRYEPEECGRIPTIGVAELQSELQENRNNTYLLDIRSVEEYELNGLKEAVHIPLEVLESSIPEIPADKTVYVICRSGNRSKAAVKFLMESRNEISAFSVEGGMEAWEKQFGIFR